MVVCSACGCGYGRGRYSRREEAEEKRNGRLLTNPNGREKLEQARVFVSPSLLHA